MRVRSTLTGLALAAGLLAAPWLASADEIMKPQGFPERPITMIVPYGAGGGSDQLSRAMAAAVESVAGINFLVVNKPGGGGRAAIPDFMTAPPDGYTVMEHIDDAATLFASGKIRENPAEDWVPLAMAQITFSQIYIRPDDDRFNDWDSFLAYAKDNAGQVTIANVGNVGSMERINMMKAQRALGFETKQISFDKPSERYAALVGGHVDALFEQPGDVRNFLDSDKMKPILTFLDNRPDAFAGVPTHKEAGADFEALLRFRGFYAKKGIPAERLDYLEKVFAAGFAHDSFQAFNEKKYMHLIDSYRDTAGSVALLNGAIDTYKTVYEELGIGQ
jgi:tripartite-type tricarboxylate transporter receptor subunit TctC